MKPLTALTLVAVMLGVGSLAVTAQTPASAVVRLDPALDQIVAPDAKVEMLKADYFGLSEGPLWVSDGSSGYLLFSDIAANVIYKWAPSNQLSIFLERSGYNSTDLTPLGPLGYIAFNGRMFIANFGSNGIVLDPQGRIVFCAQGDRAIVRLEKDGTRTVLADRFEGKRFSRPNDLVVKSDGAVYFTDPRPANNSAMELPTSGVFRAKDGTVQLLEKDIQPNGIGFTPDEKGLYVSNMALRQILRYDVQPDGTVTNRRVFIDMNADKAPGIPDGMKVDAKGYVYSTGPGGIWIISPEGKHLGTLRFSEQPTNLAFGDADYKTLYVTSRKSLERIRLKAEGLRPKTKD